MFLDDTGMLLNHSANFLNDILNFLSHSGMFRNDRVSFLSHSESFLSHSANVRNCLVIFFSTLLCSIFSQTNITTRCPCLLQASSARRPRRVVLIIPTCSRFYFVAIHFFSVLVFLLACPSLVFSLLS